MLVWLARAVRLEIVLLVTFQLESRFQLAEIP